MQPVTDERSLGELFAELADETRTLVSQELSMAKAEMSQKASEVGKSAGLVGIGGAVAYAGLLAIIAAVIFALAALMPSWQAALIVGVIVAVIGYMLVQKGMRDLKAQNLAPKKTVKGLKEDKEWIQTQTK
jgi:xanthine/uracil permease